MKTVRIMTANITNKMNTIFLRGNTEGHKEIYKQYHKTPSQEDASQLNIIA